MHIRVFVFMAMAALQVFGCSRDDIGSSQNIRLYWPNENHQYSFQWVNFQFDKLPPELSDAVVQVISDIQLNNDMQMTGETLQPILTQVGSDKYLATDPLGLLGLTVSAYMKRMKASEQEWQVDTYLSWPRTVAVEGRWLTENDQEIFDNAFYLPTSDTIVVLRPSESIVPLSINLGVLAHEHFHAYFESQLSFAKVYQRDRHVIAMYRAWNEGLADFWAYLHTNDPKFGEISLESFFIRSLVGPTSEIPSYKDWKQEILSDSNSCSDFCEAYALGTQIARRLFNEEAKLQKLSSGSQAQLEKEKRRGMWARAILASLKKAADGFSDEEKAEPKLDWILDSIFTEFRNEQERIR